MVFQFVFRFFQFTRFRVIIKNMAELIDLGLEGENKNPDSSRAGIFKRAFRAVFRKGGQAPREEERIERSVVSPEVEAGLRELTNNERILAHKTSGCLEIYQSELLKKISERAGRSVGLEVKVLASSASPDDPYREQLFSYHNGLAAVGNLRLGYPEKFRDFLSNYEWGNVKGIGDETRRARGPILIEPNQSLLEYLGSSADGDLPQIREELKQLLDRMQDMKEPDRFAGFFRKARSQERKTLDLVRGLPDTYYEADRGARFDREKRECDPLVRWARENNFDFSSLRYITPHITECSSYADLCRYWSKLEDDILNKDLNQYVDSVSTYPISGLRFAVRIDNDVLASVMGSDRFRSSLENVLETMRTGAVCDEFAERKAGGTVISGATPRRKSRRVSLKKATDYWWRATDRDPGAKPRYISSENQGDLRGRFDSLSLAKREVDERDASMFLEGDDLSELRTLTTELPALKTRLGELNNSLLRFRSDLADLVKREGDAMATAARLSTEVKLLSNQEEEVELWEGSGEGGRKKNIKRKLLEDSNGTSMNANWAKRYMARTEKDLRSISGEDGRGGLRAELSLDYGLLDLEYQRRRNPSILGQSQGTIQMGGGSKLSGLSDAELLNRLEDTEQRLSAYDNAIRTLSARKELLAKIVDVFSRLDEATRELDDVRQRRSSLAANISRLEKEQGTLGWKFSLAEDRIRFLEDESASRKKSELGRLSSEMEEIRGRATEQFRQHQSHLEEDAQWSAASERFLQTRAKRRRVLGIAGALLAAAGGAALHETRSAVKRLDAEDEKRKEYVELLEKISKSQDFQVELWNDFQKESKNKYLESSKAVEESKKAELIRQYSANSGLPWALVAHDKPGLAGAIEARAEFEGVLAYFMEEREFVHEFLGVWQKKLDEAAAFFRSGGSYLHQVREMRSKLSKGKEDGEEDNLRKLSSCRAYLNILSNNWLVKLDGKIKEAQQGIRVSSEEIIAKANPQAGKDKK